VLEAKGLGAERGGQTLFSGVDLLIRRGDRVAIVGPNGSGKTTMMKILADRGMAGDRGEVRRGTNLRDGYFDQQLGSLDDKKSGVEEIRSVRGDLNVDGAREYLARFRFYGDDPLRKVASLSGGERTRLALAKLLLEPRNLLYLDEPTNHLDIPAAEILEEALVGFEGTVILVSHDRRFLETVSTRTVSFHDGKVDVYDGGFKDYVEALARIRNAAARAERPRDRERNAPRSRQAEPSPPKPKSTDAPKTAPPGAPGPAGSGADVHRVRREQARDIERKTKQVALLEARVSELEAEVAHYKKLLVEASGSNWEELHNWAKKERELSSELEKVFKAWVSLSEELGSKGAGPEATR
jgi:ATP-binding cassette subfamily F protein 3